MAVLSEWIWDNFGKLLVIIGCLFLLALPVGAILLDPHIESRGERFDRIEAEMEILERKIYCYERFDKSEGLARIACLEGDE